MQGTAVPASERKEYFCNRCKASWTQMEVLDGDFSAQGFLCHRCKHVLVHDADRHAVGHQKSTRMNNQFKFITDLLPQIDSVVIPENTFDEAFANARPVQRAETHQAVNSVAVETGLNRPTAVKGLANTGPKNIAVTISTGDGPTEEEKAAEKARKARLAAQNALPVWHTSSSVPGAPTKTLDPTVPREPVLLKDEDDSREDKKQTLDAKESAEMDDYFAKLKAEAAAEAARKAAEEEEYESGDEDEGDFEDVVGTSTNNSAIGTPASTAGAALGAPPVAPSPLRQSSVQPSSSLKREAPHSGARTEATSLVGDERPAKKIKVEEEVEEDDGLEFVDV
jgi:transcription initiation factor TFIIE subunit alpha